jgi:hypothetical protein
VVVEVLFRGKWLLVTAAIDVWAWEGFHVMAKMLLANVLDDDLAFLHLIIFAVRAAMESILSCGLNYAGPDLRFDRIRSFVDVFWHSGKNSPLILHLNLKFKKKFYLLECLLVNFQNVVVEVLFRGKWLLVTAAIDVWAWKRFRFMAKMLLANVLDDDLAFLHLIIFAVRAAMESILSCGLNYAGPDLRFDRIRSFVDVFWHSGKNSPLILHLNLKFKKKFYLLECLLVKFSQQ